MGTYTTNYNLFMPSIGEQGWGELVNGNFSTIDTTIAGLNTRVGTLETETNAIEERVTACERIVSIATISPNTSYYYDVYHEEAHNKTLTVYAQAQATVYSSTTPISGSIALGGNATITVRFMDINGVITTSSISTTNVSTAKTVTVPSNTIHINAAVTVGASSSNSTRATLRVFGYKLS